MLNNLFNLVIRYPMKILSRLWRKLFILWLSLKQNINIKGGLVINGLPLIDIREGSKLFIGNSVLLNSRNKGYHINLHSPVKLLADRPGAEIRIGDKTRIHGSCIHAYQLVTIGNNCLIAANCQIFDGNGHDLSFPNVENRIKTTGTCKPVIIEDNVWICANSIVLPGVRIGEGSVVSANSVVVKDVPPMVVVGGNPAIILKKYIDN